MQTSKKIIAFIISITIMLVFISSCHNTEDSNEWTEFSANNSTFSPAPLDGEQSTIPDSSDDSTDLSINSNESSIVTSTSNETSIADNSVVTSNEKPKDNPKEESQIDPPVEGPKDSPDELLVNNDAIRGIWVSQFDMYALYQTGGQQREAKEYRQLVGRMMDNIKTDGYNTIFYQVRPNGDSMYESAVYPVSKYVAVRYGQKINYDPVAVFVSEAKSRGLSVHCWINPLRLMSEEEIQLISDGYLIKQWYTKNSGQVKKIDGRLYLDPSYPEVIKLIADGAAEILRRYPVDGIHMDDYFYPTTKAAFDEAEFLRSGHSDVGNFRRANINLLVRTLYSTVKAVNPNLLYSVSPAGTLDLLRGRDYADVALWCSKPGYIDIIMPQLYYGFQNQYYPFEEIYASWRTIVTLPSVKLVIGLTAGKAVQGMKGELDVYAGNDEGKTEWIRNKDILGRSISLIAANQNTAGYCLFSYSLMFDNLTGQRNPLFEPERENLIRFGIPVLG